MAVGNERFNKTTVTNFLGDGRMIMQAQSAGTSSCDAKKVCTFV
jgi:hypothetical protein